jgi:AraC family transcriptional regulator
LNLLPVPAAAAEVDTLIYRGDCVAVGGFRCRPDHPLFEDSGPIRNHCFVFPRTAVEIQHADARPFLGDPAVITLYNPGQRYRRRVASQEGDHCDYYAVAPQVMHEMLRFYDPAALDAVGGFRAPSISSPASLYLRQRRFFRRLVSGSAIDPLMLEETVLTLLSDVLAGSNTPRPFARVSSATRRMTTLIEDARRLLATTFDRPLRLSTVAAELSCSPFHLCRVFRHGTGLTLHQYRDQIRLRRALDLIEGGMDLTTLALEVGYSSHSHFTYAFRRTFGTTPKLVRGSLRPGIAPVEHRRPRLAGI